MLTDSHDNLAFVVRLDRDFEVARNVGSAANVK